MLNTNKGSIYYIISFSPSGSVAIIRGWPLNTSGMKYSSSEFHFDFVDSIA